MFETAFNQAGLRACALSVSLLALFASAAPKCAAAEAPRITVTTTGRGPDVIFIAGLASSAHVWDREADLLSGRYRVHLVQVAGFAGAPAAGNASGPIITPTVEAIDDYIRSHRLTHPAVIGHSLGGLMGLLLAKNHPSDVGKLMIVDSLPWYGMLMGPGASMTQVESAAASMRDKTVLASQAEFAANEPKVMMRLVKSSGPDAQAAVMAAAASDHSVVARAMYEDLTTDFRPYLASINTPITLLYPWDASTGAPQAAFDALYQGAYAPAPHKTTIRIDGAYHFIQVDQPEAFDRAVQSFLSN